jgi:O-antigen/teichoic acid export membrane protein
VLAATIAAGLTTLTSIARSKVTALVLGPVGMGQTSELNQTLALVFVPMGLIGGVALVRGIAHAAGDPSAQQRLYDGFATLLALAGLVLVPIAVLSVWLVFRGRPPEGAAWLGLMGAMTGVLGGLLALPSQWMMATGRSREYALISSVMAIGGAAFGMAGTWLWGIPGQFASALVGTVVVGLASWPFFTRRLPGLRLLPRPMLDMALVREVLLLGSTSVVAGLAMQGALSVIRWSLHAHGGDAANGQFQAAWAVASTYFGMGLAGLGTVYFPRYGLARGPAELAVEIHSATAMVLRQAPPLILLAMAVRVPLIHALYSDRFNLAAEMVGFQMAGDLCKGISWAQAGPLLYRGKVRAFLLSEALGAVALALPTVVLAPWLGAEAASVGYLIGYSFYVVLTKVIVERACEVKLPWGPVLMALAFGVAAAGLALVTMHSLAWSAAVALVAGLWSVKVGLFEPLTRRLQKAWRLVSA